MTYRVSKTYVHANGLSCAFRQWRAEHSHCRFIHGYSIQVRINFEGVNLDHCNWLVDFGDLKPIKSFLERTFDHKLLVARDDPNFDLLMGMHGIVADILVVENTGCECFARMIYEFVATEILPRHPNARLHSVEVWEHEGNMASYSLSPDANKAVA